MPAKKKEEAPKTVLLGRPGSHLKVGIVGLPNVGKSTFFNIMSKRSVPMENRPFCTIDPNMADVNIPDERFDKLVRIYAPASIVHAQLHIRDIAGLIRDASKGEGLGNAFLSHIAEVDGIIHMVRVFAEPDVTHVEGEVDPIRDLEIIFQELVAKDLQVTQGLIDKVAPVVARGIDKSKKADLEVLERVKSELMAGRQIRCCAWSNREIEFLNTLPLLTAKPAIFLANMSESDYLRQRNKWLPSLKTWIDEHTGESLIPFSAEFELNLSQMAPSAAEAYCTEHKTRSQLPRIINTAYHAINLIHFFTAGHDEVKCWTIQRGFKAPQAAGRIHSDMEKGFICAEVIHWADFDALESETLCREEGKYHQEGRAYEVQDGDILLIKFNTSKGGKK